MTSCALAAAAPALLAFLAPTAAAAYHEPLVGGPHVAWVNQTSATSADVRHHVEVQSPAGAFNGSVYALVPPTAGGVTFGPPGEVTFPRTERPGVVRVRLDEAGLAVPANGTLLLVLAYDVVAPPGRFEVPLRVLYATGHFRVIARALDGWRAGGADFDLGAVAEVPETDGAGSDPFTVTFTEAPALARWHVLALVAIGLIAAAAAYDRFVRRRPR